MHGNVWTKWIQTDIHLFISITHSVQCKKKNGRFLSIISLFCSLYPQTIVQHIMLFFPVTEKTEMWRNGAKLK